MSVPTELSIVILPLSPRSVRFFCSLFCFVLNCALKSIQVEEA